VNLESKRLHAIVESGKVLEFFSMPDKDHDQIQWTIFGAVETNEIIVRATVKDRNFYRSAPSPLAIPPMADRRFGIDVADDALARELSDQLWQREGEAMLELLRE
jgi:hypothetical protein